MAPSKRFSYTMQMVLALLVLLFSLPACTLPANTTSSLLAITPPSEDPFYQPPTGFESSLPGSILRSRQVPTPLALELLAPGLTAATWQILYRSINSLGEPNAIVSLIFVPVYANKNQLFAHQVAYDSAWVDCSPSYGLRTLTQAVPDIAVIALGLYQGWYVTSCDYESYSAAFTDGVQAAHGLLDALRAATRSGAFTGLSSEPRIALNGGSGGALATEWALELQSTYAPEVSIAGATLGSLTPNVSSVYETVNGGPFAGLAPAAIIGLANLSPNFTDYLNNNLVESKKTDFWKAGSQCLAQDQAQFASQNISLYFKDANFLQSEASQTIINSVGVMGLHGTPQVPFYVYKGAQDEISSIENTDALVEKYCADGAPSIIYVRNIVTGHEGEALLGLIGAYFYLRDRLNGVTALPGCTYINSTKTRFNSSDEDALGVGIVSVLNSALGNLQLTDLG